MAVTAADLSPNFINPAYATPEQLASLREYSKQLMTGKGQQEVHRAPQGFSNIVNALVGGYEGYRADQLQQQAIGEGVKQTTPLTEALMTPAGQAPQAPMSDEGVAPQPRQEVPSTPKVWGDKEAVAAGLYPPSNPSAGGAVSPPSGGVQAQATVPPAAPASPPPQRMAQNGLSPAQIAAALQNPWIPEQQKAMMRALIAPQGVKDLYGQPGYASPLGGIRPAQNPGQMPFGVQTDVQTDTTKAPAFIRPGQNGPTMQVPGMGGSSGIDALAEKGRDLARLRGINEGGSVAQASVVKEDIDFANQAPNVLKTVGTIEDNIRRFGDKMTFGPTAPWSQEAKRLAANYAPGVMKDQLDAIAAADSIDKLSGNLGSLLSRQISSGTGTDAQMLQGLKTVPGLMQSKEGALAMADMIRQAAEKQQKLGYILQDPKKWPDYPAIKSRFFQDNPIINPLTKNPIEMDIRAAKEAKPTNAGGWGIVR